eukprot:4555755-Karenia_brevis.AAC.1
MCGAPTLAAAMNSEEDVLDWERSCPVGTEEFVEQWLDDVSGKLDQVMQAIVALPEHATAGRPS